MQKSVFDTWLALLLSLAQYWLIMHSSRPDTWNTIYIFSSTQINVATVVWRAAVTLAMSGTTYETGGRDSIMMCAYQITTIHPRGFLESKFALMARILLKCFSASNNSASACYARVWCANNLVLIEFCISVSLACCFRVTSSSIWVMTLFWGWGNFSSVWGVCIILYCYVEHQQFIWSL